MATKGTKYSDVNFSVPEGADPMGIGVPDLGRSSYDPVATIRAGWMKDREKRMIKGQQRREEYQQFMEDLPSYEAINQKVAGKLNEKAVEMGKLAHQRYKSGSWSPFAKTEKGASTERELSRLQKEIAVEGQAYSAMLPKYKAAQEYLSNPENLENVDMELTRRNMSDFTEAEDIDSMNKAIGKSLIVMKPEPVELNKYLEKMYDQYIPGEDKEVVSKVYNPEMDKWEVLTQTYKDPARVTAGMKKIYDNMEKKYQNDVKRRFEDAPAKQKETIDGVPITAKDWFVSQYVPEYGKKLDLKTYAGKSEKGGVNWGYLPGRGANGLFDLTDYESEEQLGVQVGDQVEPRLYNSAATIGLQSISRMPFVMSNTPRSRNAETGEMTAPGRSTTNLMDKISILPVATENVTVTMPDNTVREINAGEKIPKNVQRQMTKNRQLGKMRWEAFATTLANNKQVPIDEITTETMNFQDISSFTETIVRPWREARPYVKGAAMERGVDISPLEEKVEGILNQLNNVYESVAKTMETASDEEAYNDAFGNK